VDDDESISAVRTAVELGVTLFDVADVYGFGHAEEVLAHGLGDDRHRVVVATKFGVRWGDGITRDISRQWLAEALEGSLRRLRMERIGLYQVHWPDDRTPISETLEALKRYQEQGKIGWIGCCNLNADQLRQACQVADVVSLQAPFNLLDRGIEADVLPAAAAAGVAVITWGSLAQGLLSGRLDDEAIRRFDPEDVRRRNPVFQQPRLRHSLAVVDQLRAIAARYGRTPGQVAIRWVLDTPGVTCALTGIKTPEQIRENAGVTWELDQHDYDVLAAAAGLERPQRAAP
jgi:aryl-alcohol dehydrogenase-like predicted oxidoreductase